MLTVKDLNKSFSSAGENVHAVKNVSFSAKPGEVVAIVGASGSGKSTLLSLLGLLDAPDSGSIELNETELATLDAIGRTTYRAQRVGFVFQQFNLVPNLTAIENVELALEFSFWPKEERRARAVAMLEMVGLDATKGDRRPGKLSGGEQQRVAIARAFAAQPELILADEPTGSLDRATGQRIVTLLRDAASSQDVIVLVVTHDDKIAAQADRRFEIEDGQLREVA
jgi:putative ABC transport system ATP-binding protein